MFDLTDEVLRCNQDDVQAANAYVLGLASRYKIPQDKLLNPPSFTVRRIAVCYACYHRALNAIGTDAVVGFDGASSVEGRDINIQKAKFYRQEIDSILNKLSVCDFTGEEVADSVSIGIYRS